MPSSVLNKYVELNECVRITCFLLSGSQPSRAVRPPGGPAAPHSPGCGTALARESSPRARRPQPPAPPPACPLRGGVSRPTSRRLAPGRGDRPRAGLGRSFPGWPMRSGLRDAGRVPLGARLPPARAVATPPARSAAACPPFPRSSGRPGPMAAREPGEPAERPGPVRAALSEDVLELGRRSLSGGMMTTGTLRAAARAQGRSGQGEQSEETIKYLLLSRLQFASLQT